MTSSNDDNNGYDNDNAALSLILDQGGYWEGTKHSQNEGFRRASMRRQSMVDVERTHGEALKVMRQHFPNAPNHDLVKFLKARDFQTQKAVVMYQAHLQWRQETFPIPRTDKLEKLLETRKFYLLDDLDHAGDLLLCIV